MKIDFSFHDFYKPWPTKKKCGMYRSDRAHGPIQTHSFPFVFIFILKM